MIFDEYFFRDSVWDWKTPVINFVCNECKEANKQGRTEWHCNRHDTWCDCGCRPSKGGDDGVRGRTEGSQ